MAELIYTVIASLDGYIEDTTGGFDWAEPDEEVHPFVNDLVRPIGTYLYGRRMYDVMVAWEHPETFAAGSVVMQDFALMWQAAEKVVYSASLEDVSSDKSRIERVFDPEAVSRMKATESRDLAIGGPDLAGLAMRAGLVDECQLFLAPVVVGGGKPALPDGLRMELDLIDERRFASGMVHLRYRVKT